MLPPFVVGPTCLFKYSTVRKVIMTQQSVQNMLPYCLLIHYGYMLRKWRLCVSWKAAKGNSLDMCHTSKQFMQGLTYFNTLSITGIMNAVPGEGAL